MRSNQPRWLTLGGVALLIVAVAIVITTPSANRYEISLYRAYPIYFWVLLVGAMLAGALTIVASARVDSGRSWVYGVSLMLLTNALLLLLPYIRGYEMFGRSDAMSHLGFMVDISNSGGIGGNIYPPMHLLAIAVSDATGVEPMTVAMLLPVVFSGIYFGAMFYLLYAVFETRAQVLFGLPFVMLPVLRQAHVGFRPFDVAIMLVPLVLYLFFKGQPNPTPPVRATFVVVLVAVLLYHPLTAIFLIMVFALYGASKYAPLVKRKYASPTNLVSLSAAVFIVWYSEYAGIILRFEQVHDSLFGAGGGGTRADTYARTIEEASPPLIDLARVFTFKYGLEFVLFGLGFAFLGMAVLLILQRKAVLDTYSVMIIGTVIGFSVFGVAFLLQDLIVPPQRPFQIAKIGAVVIVGQLFYVLWRHVDWSPERPSVRISFQTILTITLIVLIVLSTFSVYESPLESESNHQVTEMEVQGNEWLTEHGSASQEVAAFKISHHRFNHARSGTSTPQPFAFSTPPPHFNYTVHDSLGRSYQNDRYLTITRAGRIVYPEAFPNYRPRWRFTPEDFERLERDTTTNRIYDNGDYRQYLVEGNAG
ncbi:hypothetical protein [Natronomonas amylolytica]|uniref:hypothetical protein n=1 Tax=Natronomonas amylolytica TaxID=3108498 RepID=UPI00300AF2C4